MKSICTIGQSATTRSSLRGEICIQCNDNPCTLIKRYSKSSFGCFEEPSRKVFSIVLPECAKTTNLYYLESSSTFTNTSQIDLFSFRPSVWTALDCWIKHRKKKDDAMPIHQFGMENSEPQQNGNCSTLDGLVFSPIPIVKPMAMEKITKCGAEFNLGGNGGLCSARNVYSLLCVVMNLEGVFQVVENDRKTYAAKKQRIIFN